MAAEVDTKLITWDRIKLWIPNTETVYIASHTTSDNSVIVLFGKNVSHSGCQYTTLDTETKLHLRIGYSRDKTPNIIGLSRQLDTGQ